MTVSGHGPIICDTVCQFRYAATFREVKILRSVGWIKGNDDARIRDLYMQNW